MLYLIDKVLCGLTERAIVFIIVSSDPGVIERKSGSRAEFLSDIEQCKQVNYCFTCWVDKPQGAKHCGVCDRCVLQFDHHCPWLHQCITVRNMFVFLIFVASVATSSAIYSCGVVMYVINKLHNRLTLDDVLRTDTWLLFTLVLSLLHTIMLSALFFNQCMQISENVLTVDRMRRNRSRLQNGAELSSSSHSTPSSFETVTSSTRMQNIINFFGASI
uniref:Palmitoyltransferase n=1 Tax=Angiostrongylus cantonensis TaxID=6313 RepID=A0A0K0DLQ7_ANGCA